MKKQIIILGLGFLTIFYTKSYALNNYYSQYYPYRSSIYQSGYYFPDTRYTKYNSMYCPCCTSDSRRYYSRPYNMYSSNIPSRRQMRRLKKIQKVMKNNISWLNNNKGSMTGYSVPVSKNLLNNFPNKIQPLPSAPTCSTELWGSENGVAGYQNQKDSFLNKNSNDIKTGAKAGVTIIYD